MAPPRANTRRWKAVFVQMRWLRVAACALLAAGSADAQAARPAPKLKFTLGSTSSVVEKAQGRPDYVERLASLGYEVWHFGSGWVRLSYRDDVVTGWSNPDGRLEVELRPGSDTTADGAIGKGSSRDDVIRLFGTPVALVPQTAGTAISLRYGSAIVVLSAGDGRVVEWNDPQSKLKTRADRAVVIARPAAPASLAATVAFADAGGDNYLDAEERATLTLRVRNSGRGTAYRVTPVISAEQNGSRVTTVSTVAADVADSIAAGREVTLRVTIAATVGLADGELTLRAALTEANGFDLDPALSVVLAARSVRAPRLTLATLAINDQSGNGRIEPREIVEIIARIENSGVGDARDVHVTIRPGDGIVLTGDSPVQRALGTLRAGESRDVKFSAFANSRATGFPVVLSLTEARARFDTAVTLPLALDRPLGGGPSLVVRGRETAAIVAAPSLVSMVDTGIPRAPLRPNTVAVVFGVERYERAPSAPYARRDASVFREYAAQLFGIGDDASRLYFRTDDEVTSTEFRKVFGAGGWLARRVTPGTDVIVYFAGHGVSDLKTHQSYLLPNDGDPAYPTQTGYALSELYDCLAAMGARSVTVFVDACFSGRSRDGAQLLAGSRGVVVSLEHPALRSPGMAVFSAAQGDQLANAFPAGQHGLFTYWLLAGLRGGADGDRDGAVSVSELEKFLRAKVPTAAAELDREQTPEVVARDATRVLVRFK